MRKLITHKFKDFPIQDDASILILGTFNPDVEKNEAEFFYGRSRNYLWELLPKMFDLESMKNSNVETKKAFIQKYKIGFVDLIETLEVDSGQEANYYDNYIDSKVKNWANVTDLILSLPSLKQVFFTRQTFAGIPKIKEQIDKIQLRCRENNIEFHCLPTPARFINQDKINQWKRAFKL